MSSNELICVAPVGARGRNKITVRNRHGLESLDDVTFDYASPVISSIEPPYSHVYAETDPLQEFVIQGRGFGWIQDDLTRVVVGGNPCIPVWRSHTELACTGLNASSWTGSRRSSVIVEVNDLQGEAEDIFRLYNAPSISTVTPNQASSLGDDAPPGYVLLEDRLPVVTYFNETVCAGIERFDQNGTFLQVEEVCRQVLRNITEPAAVGSEYPEPF